MIIEPCFIIYSREQDRNGKFVLRPVMVEYSQEGANAYIQANSRSPEEASRFRIVECRINNTKSNKTRKHEFGVVDTFPPIMV